MISRVKPRTPRGFGEYLPQDQILFNRMFETIRSIYERFGFTPIETPAIELTEVLLAKGGGETDKQVYSLAKEGDQLSLHFDLTVPLARYVSEHYNALSFPFRRYQMQKVWRGERSQAGRFREFYQCDIDVIGSESLLVDAEIPSVIYNVFLALGLPDFTIKVNNRKILNGYFEYLGLSGVTKSVFTAIDKLEKQGKCAVFKDLQSLGIAESIIEKVLEFTSLKGADNDILAALRGLDVQNQSFKDGIQELSDLCHYISLFGVPETNYEIDLAIARGLDYYTATVYETVLNEHPGIGSVCSGGRYDNLASFYTDKKLPGVGISIGLSRLFFKLREAEIIKPERATPSEVLIAALSSDFLPNALAVAKQLRERGINTEVSFETGKIGKQMKYANKLSIPFVFILGEEEVKNNTISAKRMATGEQVEATFDEAIEFMDR